MWKVAVEVLFFIDFFFFGSFCVCFLIAVKVRGEILDVGIFFDFVSRLRSCC